jgi:hypothetical protein
VTSLKLIKYTNANAIEATWTGEDGGLIRCQAYADVQMSMLRDDVAQYGGDIGPYETLIAEVEAGIVPVPETPLPQRQAQVWDAIKAERDKRVQLGGYQVGDHWYQSDTFSRTQQIGLLLMGANIPEGLQWKTYDNGFVTMTPTLAGQIFAAAAAQDAAHFNAANAHKTAMEAAEDPESYDYSQGWPEIYTP